ncbi:hypothetical protein ACFPT7_05950 [Acidicapsa dinghuensis]|uniref:Glycerophosphodiester phosphodiesterase n=1 Tax=Acidicapsa dinghuensis TaxID=2218256 RepID=A0ABW1EDC0_9BACT|nr:hypothetical protein [Acidicapsa dinghuensis]
MKKTILAASFALATAAFAQHGPVAPGARTIMLAHNAYPDHGKYADRLDQALASGHPFAVEEDLAWTDGQSLLIHGSKNASGGDPTLDSYFFPKVTPVMERALKEGKKADWPLITLYLDIKNDPPEHLAVINQVLDKYSAWLTTAGKTDDILRVSPLDVKPMMVLVEDKQNDINKQRAFYDDVPVGGRIRVFGSMPKLDPNPGKAVAKQEAIDRQASVNVDDLILGRADNYHRWIGFDWAYIEKGGEANAGEWTEEKEKRLKDFVNYGHKLGYLVSVYCLDGYTAEQNQGWDADYNFGSRDAAMIRWKAAVKAKADFISTDHYQQLATMIASAK